MDGGWIRRDDPRWGPPPEEYDADEDVGAEDEAGWVADQDRDLTERIAALGLLARTLGRYVAAAEVPELRAAAELAGRGDARLSFTRPNDRIGGHAVVALAGSTGVGKSSLFNALARMELSPAGHLRPTTGQAYACIWDERGADPLLGWLGVAPHRRFMRFSPLDAEREATLRGLVLLDLPDMDSLAVGNRAEADRLVGIADRVVWVLDPQKYADASVHEQYLRHMGALRDVTVVVFNQSDRLSPEDAGRCRADLARLVEADGLAGVPVIATSTATGAGIDELRALLEQAVADRNAATARLDAELAEVVASLEALTPVPGPDEDEVSRDAVPELAAGFVDACGVEALAADAALAYRRRAVLWRPPWRPIPALPTIPAADPDTVAASLRRLAARVGRLLPEPWPRHLRAAATMSRAELPDDLASALATARGASPVPPLERALQSLWWFSAAVAVVSLLSGLSTLDAAPWLPLGVVAGALALGLPVLALATSAWRVARFRRVVERRMRLAALGVAREVVAPVRQVLRDYAQAHTALTAASPSPSWAYAR